MEDTFNYQPAKTPHLTAVQAAAYLCTSPKVLANWRCTRRHDLPYLKLGSKVLYRRIDLEKFLEGKLVTR